MANEELEEVFKETLYKNEWLERLVIGRILRKPKLVKKLIINGITRHTFMYANTREIFKAMEQLTRKREDATINNIAVEISDDLEDLGGLLMIKDCMKVAANTEEVIPNDQAIIDMLNDSEHFRQFHFLTMRQRNE